MGNLSKVIEMHRVLKTLGFFLRDRSVIHNKVF